jgi:hypothetical protein
MIAFASKFSIGPAKFALVNLIRAETKSVSTAAYFLHQNLSFGLII